MEQANLYDIITRSRFPLFGLALLWIFFRHTYFYNNFLYGIILDPIVQIGDCGVDIFLFLSGFGLFFSFKKNTKILYFYQKRATRIIPTVIVLLTIFGIVGDFASDNSICSIFDLSYWIFSIYVNYWFIGAIVLFYFLFPLVYYFVLPLKSILAIILSISFGVAGVFIIYCLNIPSLNQLEVYFARIPVFLMGAIFAKNLKLFSYRTTIIALLIISIPFLYILPKTFQRLFYSPIAIAFILFVPYLLNKTPSVISRLLRILGSASLEFYLIHIFVLSLGGLSLLSRTFNQMTAVVILLIIVTCISIIFNYFFNRLTAIIKNEN